MVIEESGAPWVLPFKEDLNMGQGRSVYFIACGTSESVILETYKMVGEQRRTGNGSGPDGNTSGAITTEGSYGKQRLRDEVRKEEWATTR